MEGLSALCLLVKFNVMVSHRNFSGKLYLLYGCFIMGNLFVPVYFRWYFVLSLY